MKKPKCDSKHESKENKELKIIGRAVGAMKKAQPKTKKSSRGK